MFLGLGFLELLIALAVGALPFIGAAWVLGRVLGHGSRERAVAASNADDLRVELAATQERLVAVELKLERTVERLEFAEQLRAGPGQ